ncbi:proline dehydrogenase [Kineococcus xinjiangensis]|uniref:proline dehydrogenase n=1 Tax=Kineococcus xinjiangensis TaxID=512762 RepID=A0A2S6IM53_9ACTN|nr:proline dehydrogenase family protein [Kineococcus xinjiangensis]PPK95255.1 proline dehydrogenase [Kineococcus xinjiangensis]
MRTALLGAARSDALRRAVTSSPATRPVVSRFVAGDDLDAAVRTVRELTAAGLTFTLDHLGEDTTSREQAEATRDAYLHLFRRLADEGLTAGAEASVKLSALGQALPRDGVRVSTGLAAELVAAATENGVLVTLDMEDHTTVDATLETLRTLRAEVPTVGAVLQSMLHRTEADCRDLATAGSRIRLVKGAYAEPESVAFPDKADVDRAYVRCLRILVEGQGYPMVATHDLRLVRIARELVTRTGRDADSYEFQMLYGIQPAEQRRLAEEGATVRVYVPYGTDWYGYFVRRLAERPANVGFFLRSLTTR